MGDEEETPPAQEIDFCTLGMFILGKIIVSFVSLSLVSTLACQASCDLGGWLIQEVRLALSR
jgi:hypothetical protein